MRRCCSGTSSRPRRRGRVVIVGRGGAFLLAAVPTALHVRIVAPLAERIERIMRREHADHDSVRAADRADRPRARRLHPRHLPPAVGRPGRLRPDLRHEPARAGGDRRRHRRAPRRSATGPITTRRGASSACASPPPACAPRSSPTGTCSCRRSRCSRRAQGILVRGVRAPPGGEAASSRRPPARTPATTRCASTCTTESSWRADRTGSLRAARRSDPQLPSSTRVSAPSEERERCLQHLSGRDRLRQS